MRRAYGDSVHRMVREGSRHGQGIYRWAERVGSCALRLVACIGSDRARLIDYRKLGALGSELSEGIASQSELMSIGDSIEL